METMQTNPCQNCGTPTRHATRLCWEHRKPMGYPVLLACIVGGLLWGGLIETVYHLAH